MSLESFKELIESGDYLILDSETTGLGSDAEICQIAIIDSSGNVLLDTLVKPTCPIPADASAVHGITDDMVKDAPGFNNIMSDVARILKGRHVVIYNADYDFRLLLQSAVQSLGMQGRDWLEAESWQCAMRAYAQHYGDWNEYRKSYRWVRLTDAAFVENVIVENAHNALGDCLMTLAVCKAMVKGDKE